MPAHNERFTYTNTRTGETFISTPIFSDSALKSLLSLKSRDIVTVATEGGQVVSQLRFFGGKMRNVADDAAMAAHIATIAANAQVPS